MANPDSAGRVIAGLLGYNPGPGIYSRLERAVEQMPANVRVEELPGLLKRYKEGVPGWELNEVDFPGVVGDSKVVPRQDLLDAVRERSPVHTHREVVLKNPRAADAWDGIGGNLADELAGFQGSNLQPQPSSLGRGIEHGVPSYSSYSQGGEDYTELLLRQPYVPLADYGNHWRNLPNSLGENAVAHARFDTHGDALRINELQSDLGIYNRRQREIQPVPSGRDAELIAMKDRRESDAAYIERMRELGHEVARGDDGGWVVVGSQAGLTLPFPLEDAWSDLLIKRLALEAARKGHRAIEIASPRAIADKVGGNIENYEHFYGKVVPGAIERLGRKMGGLDEVAVAPGSGGSHWADTASKLNEEIHQYITAAPRQRTWFGSNESANQYRRLVDAVEAGPVVGGETMVREQADKLYRSLMRNEGLQSDEAAEEMAKIMSLAERHAQAQAAFRIAHHRGVQIGSAKTQPPGRRYLMSDEMRKRILTSGIGASLLAPVVAEGMSDGR